MTRSSAARARWHLPRILVGVRRALSVVFRAAPASPRSVLRRPREEARVASIAAACGPHPMRARALSSAFSFSIARRSRCAIDLGGAAARARQAARSAARRGAAQARQGAPRRGSCCRVLGGAWVVARGHGSRRLGSQLSTTRFTAVHGGSRRFTTVHDCSSFTTVHGVHDGSQRFTTVHDKFTRRVIVCDGSRSTEYGSRPFRHCARSSRSLLPSSLLRSIR